MTVPHCWNAVDGADGPGVELDVRMDGHVTAKVKDVLVGTQEPDGVATVLFKDVPLTKGVNKIVMTAGGLSETLIL